MAFRKRRDKLSVVLDWVTVRYTTVWLILGLLALTAVVSVQGYSRMKGRDERQAEDEIHEAEGLRAEAGNLARDPRMKALLDVVDTKLLEAHHKFNQRDFSDARAAAIVSQNYSRKLIDGGGNGSSQRGEVRFLRVEGEVRVKRTGSFQWEDADQKMFLKAGDQLKTSSDSGAQIIYFDGSTTTIKAESLLEIKEITDEPGSKRQTVREKLNWGELEASTKRPETAGSYREVATATTVARSMDEARFDVKSDQRSGDSLITSISGNITVHADGKNIQVGERQSVKVAGGTAAAGAVEKLPAVPRPIQPVDQKVFSYSDPAAAHTNLVWEAVPEAESYRLQISDNPLFAGTLVDNSNIHSPTVELTGLSAAGYYWRVATIDAKGRVGPSSPVRKFRITVASMMEGTDTTPPALAISDLVQNGAILIINGRTEPGVTLWIDNDRVDVGDGGDFYTVVKLRREGANRIRVTAQDAAGNEASRSFEAFVETF